MDTWDEQGGLLPDDRTAARWLAWIGGVATMIGICLLLVLAIAHGWIGPRLGLALCAAAGAIAATLAVRWESRTLGALGLLGPLVAPWVLHPGSGPLDIPLLAFAAVLIVYTAVRQGWGWHACGAAVLAEIDAGVWMASQTTVGLMTDLAIVPFAAIAVLAAAALQWESPLGQRCRPAVAILVLGTLATLTAEVFAGSGAEWSTPISPLAVTVGLLAFAAPYLGLGVIALRRTTAPDDLSGEDLALPLEPIASTAFAITMILVDLALAACLHGLALTLGWGASALAMTAIRRHRSQRRTDRTLVDIGLAAHIALVLVRALIAAPPATLASGAVTPAGVLGVALLAAVCLISARSADDGSEFVPTVVAALGLLSIAYMTAVTLSGPALVAAGGGEAVALAGIHRRDDGWVTALGACGFLAGAWAHALLLEAPPWALLTGAASLPGAVLALAACALATETIRRLSTFGVRWLLPVVAVAPLYLASVAIITVFQPAVSVGIDLLDLTVRQQGQVLVSVLWTVSGLACVVAGLRRDLPGLRHGGFALLLVSAAKVFLYDMATLTSVYRVVSVIALGLMLLAGAFAYERLRPVR